MRELSHYKIWVVDWGSDCPKFEILIGSDVYRKLLTVQVEPLPEGLAEIDTILGWDVCGKFEDFREKIGNTSGLGSLPLRDFNISDLWRLETIEIVDKRSSFTKSSEKGSPESIFEF